MLWTSMLLQTALPAALIAWLAADRRSDHVPRLLLTIATGGYLVAIGVAGLWLFVPRPVFFALGACYVSAALWAWTGPWERTGTPGPRARRTELAIAFRASLAALGVLLVAIVTDGRVEPAEAVSVDLPLREERYLVVNGGDSELLNAHLMTLGNPRFAAYRGQSHGIDLVAVNRWGARASGWRPADPEAYRIFGDSVFAPCAGRIVAAEDGHPDMRPPRRDRSAMAGNHVIVECAGTWIVLGHFRRGSLAVTGTDSVARGAYLGRVGNSGNSDEPHLHIHAQRPGAPQAPLSGEPLPIRVNGRYLARNDRIARID